MLPQWMQVDVVALLSILVGSIIWFTRLEGRVSYESKATEKAIQLIEEAVKLAHKRIDDTKDKHDEMENRIFNEMGQIKISLAEISGYMRKQSEK